jgi:hypothetical protein
MLTLQNSTCPDPWRASASELPFRDSDWQQLGRFSTMEARAETVLKSCSYKLPGSSTTELIMETTTADLAQAPWNKGKLVGQKTPFKLKEIWTIRIRLQIADRCRDLALFNLAADSKLRACDPMTLRVRDVCHAQIMASRAPILQQKTNRPVQF